MRIAVAGIGYVGLSSAVLLSQSNDVTAIDISEEKVNMLNGGRAPIKDPDIELFLQTKSSRLRATTEKEVAYQNADLVIISTPTDYDPEKNFFNTSSVESVIADVTRINKNALMVIKSTIPIGFTESARARFATNQIIFSPEFLREGRALHDNLYPNRIVVGEKSERGKGFADLLKSCAKNSDAPVFLVNPREAEAIKLFANSYLAMRVGFFNELDSFAITNQLNAEDIISAVCADPRIGNYYNNPSFGYGGYCLPKDTKQLLANFSTTPQRLIEAIIESNVTRKEFLKTELLKRSPTVVGVYRLTMKTGSDNFRDSAVKGLIDLLRSEGVKLVIYEPMYGSETYDGIRIERDLNRFLAVSDVILANRSSEDLASVREKVFSRDIFSKD